MVGIRSASLGAQRIQTVRGGGSSRALSSTLDVRSVIRVGVLDDHDPVAADRGRELAGRHQLCRTSSIVIVTRSVLSTPRSGWVRFSTRSSVDASSPGAGDEGGREGVGQDRAAGTRRTGDQPGMGHAVVGGGSRAHGRDRLRLTGQVIP
jgi:hypothetical protein